MPATDQKQADQAFRSRVLTSAEAAKYCGFNNVAYWRRLSHQGIAPKPIRLSERKLGWTMGSLIDWIAERSGTAA